MEHRQREAAGVRHRDRLLTGLALLADRRAVKRIADRLANCQLVGRPLAEVGLVRVGVAPEARDSCLTIGLPADCLLEARDEVAAPLDLVGQQRAQRGGVAAEGRELHGPDGRGAMPAERTAPVVGVALQDDAGSTNARDRVRTGATGVGSRNLLGSPADAQMCCGTMYTVPATSWKSAYSEPENLTVTVSPLVLTPVMGARRR